MSLSEVIYIGEHRRCENFDTDGNIAEVINSIEMFQKNTPYTFIVYVISGTISLLYANTVNYVLSERDFMLFPPGTDITAKTDRSVKILILKINGPISLCCRYSLEKLYRETNDDGMVHAHLQANEIVRAYMEGLTDNIENGLRCIRFLEIKTQELFYYLRFYYKTDDLARFYYPLLGADAQFMNSVWKNYRKARNVEELASMANLSLSAFNKKFKRIVGKAAGQWLVDQKNKNVYHDICRGEKSLKEISNEYHFASPSHLGTFCKKQFGKLPSELRREKNGM